MSDWLKRIKNVFSSPKSEEIGERLGLEFITKLGLTEARLGGLSELESCRDPNKMERIAHTFASVYLKPKVAERFLEGLRKIKIVISLNEERIRDLELQLEKIEDRSLKKQLEARKRYYEYLRRRAIDQLRQYIYRFYIASFRAKDLDLSHTIVLKGEGRQISTSFGGGFELEEMLEGEENEPETDRTRVLPRKETGTSRRASL